MVSIGELSLRPSSLSVGAKDRWNNEVIPVTLLAPMLGSLRSGGDLEFVRSLSRDYYKAVELDLGGGTSAVGWYRAPNKSAPGVLWVHSDTVRELGLRIALSRNVQEAEATEFAKTLVAFTLHSIPDGLGLPVNPLGVTESKGVMVLPIPQNGVSRVASHCTELDDRRVAREVFGRIIKHEFFHASHQSGEEAGAELAERAVKSGNKPKLDSAIPSRVMRGKVPIELVGLLSPFSIGKSEDPTNRNPSKQGSDVGRLATLSRQSYSNAVQILFKISKSNEELASAQKEVAKRVRNAELSRSGVLGYLSSFAAKVGIESKEVRVARQEEAKLAEQTRELVKAYKTQLFNSISAIAALQRNDQPERPVWFKENLWARALELKSGSLRI